MLQDTEVYDLAGVMRDDPPALHRGVFGGDPAYWDRVSPLARLTRPMAPVLLVAARTRWRDTTAAATRFATALRARGGQAEVLPVPLGHMQTNRRLGQAAAYTAAVDRWIARAIG